MQNKPANTELERYALELGRCARLAGRELALASGSVKDRCIAQLSGLLRARTGDLVAANERDIAAAHQSGLTTAQIDRLRLTSGRIESMVRGLDDIIRLPDPVAEIIDRTVRPNGLMIEKVRVPLGVVFFIYEARPNVTTDAAALCLKSGNAVILRGGKEAMHSNRAIQALIRESLANCGLADHAVQMVDNPARELVDHLLHLSEYIDLVVPRGGEGLIRRVAAQAKMPVMKHYQGICHVYVHEAADSEMARRVILNAKCQRPAMCNAAESLLVDRAIARDFLPSALAALRDAGVELRGCPETQEIAPGVRAATEQDYATEYLDLKLSVRVVANLDEAVDHITRFGSAHTDAIITSDAAAASQFARRVDSAAVMINASTRFNDGGEFGLGAEIGISTDKYHARGPCGLRELTSYKYVVRGAGQVRNA
jgi:glutamate-5-semialdehyde dehydrogenase